MNIMLICILYQFFSSNYIAHRIILFREFSENSVIWLTREFRKPWLYWSVFVFVFEGREFRSPFNKGKYILPYNQSSAWIFKWWNWIQMHYLAFSHIHLQVFKKGLLREMQLPPIYPEFSESLYGMVQSKCGPSIRDTSIMCKLVINANSWLSP